MIMIKKKVVAAGGPVSMAYVNSAQNAAGVSVNLPTNLAGDLLVYVAADFSTNTDPGAITDWTQRLTSASGTNRFSLYHRVSPGGVVSVAAATGGQGIVGVYRPSNGTGAFGNTGSYTPGSSVTIAHPAIDLDIEDGSSLVVAGGFHRNCLVGAAVMPSMTLRQECQQATTRRCWLADSAMVASWAGSTWTGMAGSSTSMGFSVELKVAA